MNAHAAVDDTTTTRASSAEAAGRSQFLAILAAAGGFAGRKGMLTRCKAAGMSTDDALCIKGVLRMSGQIEIRLNTTGKGFATTYIKLPAAA